MNRDGRLWGVSAAAVFLAVAVSGCVMRQTMQSSEEGDVAVRSGDHNLAVVHYTNAIAQEGERYDLFLKRGRSFAAMRRNDEALRDYNAATELRPAALAEVARLRAPLIEAKGDYAALLRDADAVLQVTPADGQFLYYRALGLQETGRADEALEVYAQAAARTPRNSSLGLEIAHRKARCHYRLKQYGDALTVFIEEYVKPKQAAGIRLTDDDYFQAGGLYKVNLMDRQADEMWSHLSAAYRKEKGLQ